VGDGVIATMNLVVAVLGVVTVAVVDGAFDGAHTASIALCAFFAGVGIASEAKP
jgi:hypothetical protein